MQPRVTFGPSSWILTIGAGLAAIGAGVQSYTDAGGPGSQYLAGLSAILAAVLAVLRTVQALNLNQFGDGVIVAEDDLLDDLPAEPTDVALVD